MYDEFDDDYAEYAYGGFEDEEDMLDAFDEEDMLEQFNNDYYYEDEELYDEDRPW